MSTERPFQVDPIQTAIAMGYRNPERNLIADAILPRVATSSKFAWIEYGPTDSFTIPNTRVGRKSRPNQVEIGGLERTSEVDDYGLDIPIPTRDQMEADAQAQAGTSTYDPETRATRVATDLILLDRELRVANTLFALSTYATDKRITLSGTSQFNDRTNSDPLGVIANGLDATLIMRPNTIVLGRQVWSQLRRHPRILSAIKGGTPSDGMATIQQVAELFEVSRVLVGDATINNARPGQAANLSRAWGKHIALLFVDPNFEDPETGVSFGFTAQWGTRQAGEIPDPNMGVRGGHFRRVFESVKEVISARDVGYFIQNAVA